MGLRSWLRKMFSRESRASFSIPSDDSVGEENRPPPYEAEVAERQLSQVDVQCTQDCGTQETASVQANRVE